MVSMGSWSWRGGLTNLQFLQGEHVLEDNDLVKLGRLLGDGLDVVIVPVGEFASTAESAWEESTLLNS